MNLRMFTDGACSSNPGPGGYAALIGCSAGTKVVSGFEKETTNNRMELMAVIEGMSEVLNMIFLENNEIKKLEIISDSAYVVNAINMDWLKKWKLNGFKNTEGKDIKNIDLWMKLDEYLETLEFISVEIVFTKIKGHNGNYFNEMVDEIAKKEITKNASKKAGKE